MSWELVSFLILGAVLLGGFAWYERSRPPAQVVALVAALAALAIAGRIAFAAFPNVKPTTDIVIFAGFALGAAPGFAVGALAALVSNFWFGQGPWTPWQMAGWGLCGVLGALVALGFRNAGRLTLAATCGFAGIAYGALLNFSLMATYGGELSLERFGVLMARAIPFDVAHAVGNIVLALIAGPAIIRMLTRFRRRFEWERGGGAPSPPSEPPHDRPPPLPPTRGRVWTGRLAPFVVAALLLGALLPGDSQAAGPKEAVSWLRSVQNADGGFGSSPEDDSGTEMTAWAMLGLEAAGVNPHDVAKGKHTPITYLRGHVDELKSPGDLARTIIALLGAGADPRDFGGRNLVSDLHDRRLKNGSYKNWLNSTAFAVIALRAAGSPGGTDDSLAWIRKVQNDDGGWGIEPGTRSDAESTGSVLQALSPDSKAAKRGLGYLRESQQSNGGYRIGGNGVVNTQATAWAVQGLLAAGADPAAVKRNGKSALDYLAANQAGNGHYRYSKSSDQTPVWVTAYALVAVSEKYYPIAAPPRKRPPDSKQAQSASSAGTGGASPTAPAPSVSPSFAGEPGAAPPSGDGTPKALSEALEGQGGAGARGGAAAEEDASGGAAAPGSADSPTEADPGTAEEPAASPEPATQSAEESSGSDSDSGVAGAILIGLLAGCLLFGLGLLGRKGWMRWRYGL
jgi:energy-coupling factor transport system substrate-specific component